MFTNPRLNAGSGTILCLDIGTTFFKAVLMDRSGGCRAQARLVAPIAHPAPARWELPAGTFAEAVDAVIERLFAACPEARDSVAAVTFASQANSVMLRDDADMPLGPFVLWPDQRAAGQRGVDQGLRALEAHRARTGVPALDPHFMAAKLLALKTTQPDILARGRRVCQLADDLAWRWSGRRVLDAGIAGLTGLYDVPAGRWIPEACEAVGISPEVLPEVCPAGTVLGPLCSDVARAWGVPADTRVVLGTLDQYAGAVGVGNMHPGGISETTGTVLAVVHGRDRWEPAPKGYVQGPGAFPGRYYAMAFGAQGGNLLEWYRRGLPDAPSCAALDALAAAVAPGAGGLRLRPEALSGPVAAGFVGGDGLADRGRAVRCILETVADALAGHLRALDVRTLPREIRCAGGGARSDLWLQIKADRLGVPMTAMAGDEPTSLGAALLAARALGWGTLEALADQWVRPRKTLRPGARTGAPS